MRTTPRAAAALLALACCCTPAAAKVTDPVLPESGFTRQLAQVINSYRQLQGLPALEVAMELESLADEHSMQMAARRRLSHDGFNGRLDRSTSRLCVENVGWNYPTAEALLDGWRHSPGHLRNLLEPEVRRMGLATRSRYVTFFACH